LLEASDVDAPAVPRWYRVASVRQDTTDTVTFRLDSADEALPTFAPGQFAMLTGFGVGEVPISVSGVADGGDRAFWLQHTVRTVGAVSTALCSVQPGQFVGVRGPYGTAWDLGAADGGDVVIVAGGIGLAPLRPLVVAAAAHRERFGRVVLLVGARTPAELLYGDEMQGWRDAGVEVALTVDRPDESWTGAVGVVTTLLAPAHLDPQRSVAFVCGPDIMMRYVADGLVELGLPAARVQVSLERTMRCGAGWCGHCQLGPLLVCRDGPVVTYDGVADLMRVREL
jgi:NAD(P)H-flavin reductase